MGLPAHSNPVLGLLCSSERTAEVTVRGAVHLAVEGSTLAQACYPVSIIRLSVTFLNEGSRPQAIYVGFLSLL